VDKVRFGVFEADLRAGELRKHGVRIHLQRQPFKILAALIDRPGEVVTREDLRQLIWGAETVVDFDHSLGTAINKLRESLSDSADTPQFIETLAKRGFRFIARVEPIGAPPREEETATVPTPSLPAPLASIAPPPAVVVPAAPDVSRQPFAGLKRVAAGVAIAILVAIGGLLFLRPPVPPSIVRFSHITSGYSIYPGQTDIERFPGVATDGVRVYFPDYQNGRVGLAYVLIGAGKSIASSPHRKSPGPPWPISPATAPSC